MMEPFSQYGKCTHAALETDVRINWLFGVGLIWGQGLAAGGSPKPP